jgi:glycine/D-amino acid oxidase-like deaminating enzyme
MNNHHYDVAVIGAGVVGLATAYYLKQHKPQCSVVLLDPEMPMSFTSAQSGENYRNWWPHPVMTSFTDHSINLLEEIARQTQNTINMTRRGYLLCTRADSIDQLLAELEYGYSNHYEIDETIRINRSDNSQSYQPPHRPDWESAPDGVDVLHGNNMVSKHFPSLANDINALVHIRRAGSIDSYALGQHMLQQYRSANGVHLTGKVTSIKDTGDGYSLETTNAGITVTATQIVNAAGPFVNNIAAMHGEHLPVNNIVQQKVAFEDVHRAIPRTLPFCIDLDEQQIDWSAEERQQLADSEDFRWLTQTMPGAIHCRPDGGDHGTWVKLGWAYNDQPAAVVRAPELLDAFPEIVIRGAARIHPQLKAYYQSLPRAHRHYPRCFCRRCNVGLWHHGCRRCRRYLRQDGT